MATHLNYYSRTSDLQMNWSGNAVIQRCDLKLFKVKGGFKLNSMVQESNL